MLALLAALLAPAFAAPPPDSLFNELGKPPAVTPVPGVTAWRFADPTEAYAASLVASKQNPQLRGNYLVFCDRPCPNKLELPQMHDGPLPALRTYLPEKYLVPGTPRYILNEGALAAAAPQIPPAAAAFQFGTEAITGHYQSHKTDQTLAIFNFPTPQIARTQLLEFQKIPNAVARRSGPLIAVVLNPASAKDASQLLSDLQYAASISWDEKPPLIIRPQTAAQIVLAGMELAGIILVFCLVSGLAYAGIRILQRRFGNSGAEQGMIVLGLEDK